MIEGASQAASARGTVFWRITEVESRDGVESLIEIQADGSVLREVDIATDGTPIRITRPGEWGVWNDDPYPPTPTDAEEFQSEWSALGSEISREDFDAIYARADALLPQIEPLSPGETKALVVVIVVVVIVALAFLAWIGFIG